MSRQISIDAYFKTKASPHPLIKRIMSENSVSTKKRRSLSLLKSPGSPKIVKCTDSEKTNIKIEPDVAEVICLSSDDENSPSTKQEPNISLNSSDASNSFDKTVIYTLSQTPIKTPCKTPKTPTSGDGFPSPSSRKFYSPTLKRSVTKKTPVKRNLAQEFICQPKVNSVDDFTEACVGMDDKTIFLLEIINKYLKDPALKPLLLETSQELLGRCFHINKPGMRLVCRLYWRQPGWFRRDQLVQISGDKKEVVGDQVFQEMMVSLVENSIVTASTVAGINSLTFEEYSKILRVDEMKQICKELKLKMQTKQDAVEALDAFRRRAPITQYFKHTAPANNERRVIEIMRSKAGPCYKLSDTARRSIYSLYVLMYLGARYSMLRDKKLELVLLNDKIHRETYPVDESIELDSAAAVFRSREDFSKYLKAHIMYETFLAETDTAQKCKIARDAFQMYNEIDDEDMMRYKSLPIWLRRFTPPYLFVKMLESGIQELKKDKSGAHWPFAVDVLTKLIDQVAFRQHKKGDWFAEKALILHKLMAKHTEAAQVLLEGLNSSIPEELKDVLRPRALKLAKQQNIELETSLRQSLIDGATSLVLENQFPADHVSKQPMENYKQRGKKKFEIHTEEDKKFLDCEEYCILHYTANGPFTHGEHWEGRIITTIYHLLFWDIIYTKPLGIVGVFLSHYQMHPLDMYTDSFYANRRTVIDDRLKKVASMAVNTLVETMRAKWDERPETELSGINRTISWDEIRAVVECLGGPRCAALCGRLARHYGRTHAGFPDLTLWNAATKKIKFVEVKTDTDKPSMKQLQWMQFLQANDIDVGFCYVGVNTARCRARREPGPSDAAGTVPKVEPRTMRDSIVFESSSDVANFDIKLSPV